MRHGFDADIPRLDVDIVYIGSAAAEAGRLIDLIGESGGQQNLCQQRVWVKSNGRQQIIELLRREGLDGRIVLSRKQRRAGRQ
jgi:hypothetical protein